MGSRDVFIDRARCEGLIDGKPSRSPASPARPSAPAATAAAPPAPAAPPLLLPMATEDPELEAAKASAERTIAEATAELEREVEAKKDCGWFPENCKPDKPGRKPEPPSLETVDNLGTRCAKLALDGIQVDEQGNASYEFVLTNRCGTMQLVNVQVAEDVNDPAPPRLSPA